MEEKISFRKAEKKDSALILTFIKAIAEYEKMSDQVLNDESKIKSLLFDKKVAEVIFLLLNDKEIGFALYFYNYSTFVGKTTLYLEDLFIYEKYRHCGYGKLLFNELINIAVVNDCGRMEWTCLNWNKTSIKFYKSLGSVPMNEWTTYRLDNKTLIALNKENKKGSF